MQLHAATKAIIVNRLKTAAGVSVIVRRVAWSGWGAISACDSYAALVAEIDDRIRFSKHFVILGNVECLGLPQYPPGHNEATPPNYNWDSGSRFQPSSIRDAGPSENHGRSRRL